MNSRDSTLLTCNGDKMTVQMHTRDHSLAQVPPHSPTYRHTHTLTHQHTDTHTLTHQHTDTHTLTHQHTDTHTHTDRAEPVQQSLELVVLAETSGIKPSTVSMCPDATSLESYRNSESMCNKLYSLTRQLHVYVYTYYPRLRFLVKGASLLIMTNRHLLPQRPSLIEGQ